VNLAQKQQGRSRETIEERWSYQREKKRLKKKKRLRRKKKDEKSDLNDERNLDFLSGNCCYCYCYCECYYYWKASERIVVGVAKTGLSSSAGANRWDSTAVLSECWQAALFSLGLWLRWRLKRQSW
jgi:hypothetical protein